MAFELEKIASQISKIADSMSGGSSGGGGSSDGGSSDEESSGGILVVGTGYNEDSNTLYLMNTPREISQATFAVCILPWEKLGFPQGNVLLTSFVSGIVINEGNTPEEAEGFVIVSYVAPSAGLQTIPFTFDGFDNYPVCEINDDGNDGGNDGSTK